MSGITTSTRFEGLDALTQKLREVGAASQAVFMQAAETGGRVVQQAAIMNAPGPGIGIEVALEGGKAVASIGPLKSKWFYRFREFGTKAHGPKHKQTRYQKDMKRAGIGTSDKRRSMMRWYAGGSPIFARRVRGVAAKPFLQPAMERTDAIVGAVGNVYMNAIREKTG